MAEFKIQGDPVIAVGMRHYMRNKFPFVGAKTPERKLQTRPLIKASRQWTEAEVLARVAAIYARPEREYQYAAIDLARAHVREYNRADLLQLRPLFLDRPWWDSVDALRPLYGDYVRLHPAELTDVFDMFAHQDSFWLRRVGITLQLHSKAQTDTQLLQQAIEADLTTDEFFIQKAIGWALRQYSKTNPDWVRAFFDSHDGMSTLAIREGSKYI